MICGSSDSLGEGNNIGAAVLLNKHATANFYGNNVRLCTRKKGTNEDGVIELKR